MKLTPEQKHAILSAISGHFLCGNFDEKKMTQAEKLDAIDEIGKWEAYEDWDDKSVLSQIEGIYESVLSVLKKNDQKTAKEKGN